MRPIVRRIALFEGAAGCCRALLPGLLVCMASLTFLAVPAGTALAAKAAGASSGRVLPGGNGDQPVNIEAAKLDYFDKEQKLIYTGNVVATQGDARLKTNTLTIYLNPKESGDSNTNQGSAGTDQVRRMEASGSVILTSKDQIGTGEKGVYEKAENKVTLTGNVTLTQGPNVTKGDRLVYDLNTSQAVVTGRVRSLFLPSDNKKSTTSKTQ